MNGQFNWKNQTAYVGFNYRFESGKNKVVQEKKEKKMKPKVVEDFK